MVTDYKTTAVGVYMLTLIEKNYIIWHLLLHLQHLRNFCLHNYKCAVQLSKSLEVDIHLCTKCKLVYKISNPHWHILYFCIYVSVLEIRHCLYAKVENLANLLIIFWQEKLDIWIDPTMYIQYSSCLSWHLFAVNTLLFNFCRDSGQNMRVTRNGLHASWLSCTARELFFVCCMQVKIPVLHESKKHASNVSFADGLKHGH